MERHHRGLGSSLRGVGRARTARHHHERRGGAGQRRGSSGRRGRSSHAVSSCSWASPVTAATHARKSAVVTSAVAVLGRPLAQQRRERGIPRRPAQRLEDQRTAFVDAIIEHAVGARIGEHQVLRLSPQPGVMVIGERGDARAAGALRPQPFREAGESLVQPDVTPARDSDAVAEPLVGDLVRRSAAATPSSVWLAPKTAIPCASRGISRSSAVSTIVQSSCGYGTEGLLEHGKHARHIPEGTPRDPGRRGGVQNPADRRAIRSDRCLQAELAVRADMHRGEMGRHRHGALEAPGARRARARHTDGAPRRSDGVGRLRRHADAVAGTIIGPVVAREPGRSADRLRGDECAVFQLLPSDGAPPRSARPWRAGVVHLDRERLSWLERVPGRHPELSRPLVEHRLALARRRGRG